MHAKQNPIPLNMRAILVTAPGGPDHLCLGELPTPSPAPGEVLIRVAAAGLNRADVLQRQGHYPPPHGAPETLGLEVAGIIAALGAGADRWKLGDRVCALLAGGGYAEYVCCPAGQCLPVADSMPLAEAAALPEAAFTVYANLFDQPLVRSGETLLVQGGASGIGSFAIQAGHALGVRVAVTAGSEDKLSTCRRLGADLAVSYKADWEQAVRDWTSGKGIDCILDMIGGDYFPRHIDLLAPLGRLTHIAYARGAEVSLDLRKVMQKRLTVTGSTLRSRSASEKERLRNAIEKQLWSHVVAGSIQPVIDRTFPLEGAAQAHAYLETGSHTGKVLLICDSDA